MRTNYANILGGLAGALALNIVHQIAKKFINDAPHVDEIGEEALTKTVKLVGGKPPKGDKLFGATMAADIVSNAIYYSMIGKGGRHNLLKKGLISGAMAGMGALKLTSPLGLDDRPVNKTKATQAMTLAWYTIGGLVAGVVIKCLRNERS